jgi:hypothetical protein
MLKATIFAYFYVPCIFLDPTSSRFLHFFLSLTLARTHAGVLVAEVNTGSVLRAASLVADTRLLRAAFAHTRLFRAHASIWTPGEIVFCMCSGAHVIEAI